MSENPVLIPDRGQKWFVLLLGPTGSGKSKLKNETLKKLGIDEINSTYIGIDDYVEADQFYHEKINEILGINGIDRENTLEDKENKILQQIFKEPDTKLLKAFNEAYFASRTGFINGEKVRDIKKHGEPMDELHDKELYSALLNKRHVITEVTGLRGISWFVNLAKGHGYKVVISVPLVMFGSLKENNENRAYNMSTSYSLSH